MTLVQIKKGATRRKRTDFEEKLRDFPFRLQPAGGTRQERLHRLFDGWYGCRRCHLHELKNTDNICFGSGNPDSRILIVGESPGEEEEAESLPFIGESGKLLNQLLAATSADPDIKAAYAEYNRGRMTRAKADVFHAQVNEWRNGAFFFTNAIACRPPDNRTPVAAETDKCYERVYNMIYIIDPYLIVTFGKTAAESVLQVKCAITQEAGNKLEAKLMGHVREIKYPVFPCLHPSFLLRKGDWQQKSGWYAKTNRHVLSAMRAFDEMKFQHEGVEIPERLDFYPEV